MSNIDDGILSDAEDNFAAKHSDVYLGFVDAAIKDSDEVRTDDTFIGGEPIWLHPDSLPEEDLLRCGSCHSVADLKLLIQAFAPLDAEQVGNVAEKLGLTPVKVNPEDERVLYVFMCTKCSRKPKSVRCIRGVKKGKNSDFLQATMTSSIQEKDFKINRFEVDQSSSNPFAVDAVNFESPNPFAITSENPFSTTQETTQEKSKSAADTINPKVARKEHDSLPDKKFDGAFPGFFLYVEEESFKNKIPDHLKLPKNVKIDKTVLDLDPESEGSFGGSNIELDPRTEKLSKFLDDDVFQKFQDVAGYNPLQVLRYHFGGEPLYYAAINVDLPKVIPSPGYNPSSKRVFEMQLMPKMILDLEETVLEKGGMEWGTIMIFTDVENYITKYDEHGVGYVEECVRVQWETEK
ncbi:LAME_0E11342g1_1 [Lachancea meyersii CBS 8951]|uniref:LAME_0E11342g1_1 n=1 Tax=Lachancea meyersii CBS 8951 TaxID=1266667 RepID=A0A1G4JKT0_9SACH|nr:LAME_0E11342g1_1 [Lachancea meyersii CBS 8951]